MRSRGWWYDLRIRTSVLRTSVPSTSRTRTAADSHRRYKGTEARKPVNDILGMYRQTIRMSKRFDDPIVSEFVEWRARSRYRKLRKRTGDTAARAVVEAERALRNMKRAQKGNMSVHGRILKRAYGETGRVKHVMQNVVHDCLRAKAQRGAEPVPRLRLGWRQGSKTGLRRGALLQKPGAEV